MWNGGASGVFAGIEGLYRGPEALQQWADVIHSDWKDFEVSLDKVLHDETRKGREHLARGRS